MPDTAPGAVAIQPEQASDLPRDAARAAGKPRQASLFGGQKVIPFEALAATRRQYGRRREAARTPTDRAAARAAQTTLELRVPEVARPRTADYRYAHVADMGMRARAAAIDALFCLAAIGIFAATFHLVGGEFCFTRATLPWWAAAALLVSGSYHLIFALAGTNTAGMACCRLAVVSFDGVPARPRARVARLFWAVVGMASVGLGIAWALLDDERLTWHDMITKTFPTPLEPAGAPRRG
ncbi:MAG: RDD family protein [bacterium]|jgi:uncharacterized RDD family membrane protein YckC